MAKGIYLGVAGVKQSKKVFCGVGGVKKVKKAWVGVNGTPRLMYSAEISYKGTITPLSASRTGVTGTYNNNYALFALGVNGSKVVDAYNSALVRSNPIDVSVGRYNATGEKVGNYALFAGGYNGSEVLAVDAYDSNLARSQPQQLPATNSMLASSVVGNYAIFTCANRTMAAYDNALVRSYPPMYPFIMTYKNGGGGNDKYACFQGGYTGSEYAGSGICYDASLLAYYPPQIAARIDCVGAISKNYALFAGGYYTEYKRNFVDAYDLNLVRTSPTALSVARDEIVSESLGEYIIFVGGFDGTIRSAAIDVYDASLVKIPSSLSLTVGLTGSGISKIGSYILIGGGQTPSAYTNAVNVFEV